jgi:hypothetical protein
MASKTIDQFLNELSHRLLELDDAELQQMKGVRDRILGQIEAVVPVTDHDEKTITMAADMAFYELVVVPKRKASS